MTAGQAPGDAFATAVIDGLQRRAARLQGPARLLLEQRIDHWQARASSPSVQSWGLSPVVDPSPSLAALTALVDQLGRTRTALPQLGSNTVTLRPGPAAPAPLKAVAAYQGTWSRLRAEQRLRQALAQVPAKAGPLNSSQVVHRALQMMYSLSPGYLDAFMAHIDTLLWLEQSSGAGDLTPRAAGRTAAAAVQRPPPARRSTAGKARL